MLRWIVAITPIAGAILLPLLVPITIAKAGLAPGLILTLLLSTLWFIAMLRTSEMPH